MRCQITILLASNENMAYAKIKETSYQVENIVNRLIFVTCQVKSRHRANGNSYHTMSKNRVRQPLVKILYLVSFLPNFFIQ